MCMSTCDKSIVLKLSDMFIILTYILIFSEKIKNLCNQRMVGQRPHFKFWHNGPVVSYKKISDKEY